MSSPPGVPAGPKPYSQPILASTISPRDVSSVLSGLTARAASWSRGWSLNQPKDQPLQPPRPCRRFPCPPRRPGPTALWPDPTSPYVGMTEPVDSNRGRESTPAARAAPMAGAFDRRLSSGQVFPQSARSRTRERTMRFSKVTARSSRSSAVAVVMLIAWLLPAHAARAATTITDVGSCGP